jgi:hypothetical protein
MKLMYWFLILYFIFWYNYIKIVKILMFYLNI